MEFVSGVAVKLEVFVARQFFKCCQSRRDIRSSLRNLEEVYERLVCRRMELASRLQLELRGEATLGDEVKLWLERVEDVGVEIALIREKLETRRKFVGANLMKNILRKTEEVEILYSEGQFSGELVQRPRVEVILPTSRLGGKTQLRIVEEIWACLMNDDVTKIGVYGMAGVGKTTALKHINDLILESREFDNVIWITMSRCPNIMKLQYRIASSLELDMSRFDDDEKRAVSLRARLSEKQRYVLILDDLWDVYRLDEVGIPEPSPQNGSKLVLTTRSLDVCLRMSCQAIRMDCLSDEEAMDLFMDIVGHDVLSVPNLEAIVHGVVRECGGLPLAIVTVASSLRGVVDHVEWMIALEELRESVNGSSNEELFEKLKFSYDRLNDKRLQLCLVYCALYPEDYAIERSSLLEHLIAEEIIVGRKIRQSEIDRGHAMLNKLVNSCLLNDTINDQGEKCVKMHDVIRLMALQIARESSRVLVKAGMGLTAIPDEENWEGDLVEVSLMSNDIIDIPSSTEPPKCPRLSTLLLSKNPNLQSIPDDFFLHMMQLKVLDVSETAIEYLPASVSDLVTLTALFLGRCEKLKYVPTLAKLRHLKTLDFYGSGIKEVPQGVEMLVRLRYLNFEAKHLKKIFYGILCNLGDLQYLSLNRQGKAPTVKAEELENLRKLETFGGVLDDINSFNAYVRSLEQQRLTSYVLQLGNIDDSWFTPAVEANKVVLLVNCDVSENVAAGGSECPLLLPEDVEILGIQRCHINGNNLCDLTSFKNVVSLRECRIADCDEIEHVFSYSSSIFPLLQNLEELHLARLPGLQGLIRLEREALLPLPPGAFSSLRCINMAQCNRIKKLFMIASLPNLEELRLSGCEELKEIITTTASEDEDQDRDGEGQVEHRSIDIQVILPKLKKLLLESLPKLQSLPMVADCLHEIEIGGCPKLKRIPILDREPCSPSLLRVHIDDVSWEALEWNHLSAKDVIQSLRK